MAKRRSSKSSLYELIKTRPTRGHATNDDAPPAEEAPPDSAVARWLAPGRAITVPIGYVLLAAALAIAAVIIAYVVGYDRAERAERRRYEQQLLVQAGALDAGTRPRDPLLDAEPSLGDATGGSSEESGTGGSRAQPGGIDDRDIQSDPRLPGHTYFVLMTTNRQGSMRLARFSRRHDLETHVVPYKNDLFLVIALPGFPPGTSNQDPEFTTLRDRIKSIGDLWKREAGDTSGLDDAYPLTYEP